MDHEHDSEERWHLPFAARAQLEVTAELVSIILKPVQPGETPWLEFTSEAPAATRKGRKRGLFGIHGTPWMGREAVKVKRSGETVMVDASGPIPGELILHVPPDVEAEVRTEVGPIEAHDLGPCGLMLESEAGQIRLTNVTGRLHLATEAGRIDGKRLSGRFEVETEAGAIRLEVLGLDAGDHHVEAEAGSIHLDLAPGLAVGFDVSVEGGSVTIDYPEHPEPTATMRIETEVGSVRVRELQQRPAPAVPPPPPTPPAPPTPPTAPDPAGRFAAEGAEDGELERILKMVEEGRLTAGEAHELIRAIGEG